MKANELCSDCQYLRQTAKLVKANLDGQPVIEPEEHYAVVQYCDACAKALAVGRLVLKVLNNPQVTKEWKHADIRIGYTNAPIDTPLYEIDANYVRLEAYEGFDLVEGLKAVTGD